MRVKFPLLSVTGSVPVIRGTAPRPYPPPEVGAPAALELDRGADEGLLATVGAAAYDRDGGRRDRSREGGLARPATDDGRTEQ